MFLCGLFQIRPISCKFDLLPYVIVYYNQVVWKNWMMLEINQFLELIFPKTISVYIVEFDKDILFDGFSIMFLISKYV